MPLSSCGCGGTRIPGSPGRPHTLSCRSVCVDGGSYEGCFSRATATASRSVATMSGSGARRQVTSRLPGGREASLWLTRDAQLPKVLRGRAHLKLGDLASARCRELAGASPERFGFALGITTALAFMPLTTALRHLRRRPRRPLGEASSSDGHPDRRWAARSRGRRGYRHPSSADMDGVVGSAVLLGFVNVVDSPGRQAFTDELVGPDLVANAVSLNNAAITSARAIGPAMGGALIATVGIAPCFLINAASYAVVVLALLYGLMMSSLGVGMVIGSLVSAAWSKPTLCRVIALVELLAVALLAVTVAPDLRLAVLAIAAMGASASLYLTSSVGFLQLHSRDARASDGPVFHRVPGCRPDRWACGRRGRAAASGSCRLSSWCPGSRPGGYRGRHLVAVSAPARLSPSSRVVRLNQPVAPAPAAGRPPTWRSAGGDRPCSPRTAPAPEQAARGRRSSPRRIPTVVAWQA
jgi:hypothetical protein